jgi:hypothetical protein
MRTIAFLLTLTACERLGPLGDDPMHTPADANPTGARYVMPAGATVPHVSDNPSMLADIRANDGLSDTQLAMANGVLVRTAGKAGGVNVMFWNFGPALMSGNFPVVSSVYVLVDGIQPVNHPELIDTIPGDPRYSQVRRVMNVPVTATYAGELITSIDALAEALEMGIIGEPVSAGVWRNMPVVPPDTKLELGGTAAPLPPSEVYALGHRVTVFRVGVTQPLRNNSVSIGQESRLISGVPTGTPPVMPTTADAVPVFQYGIPAAPPTDTLNYTPLATQVDVKLAPGVAPTTVLGDAQLYRRMPASTGAINGYFVDTVTSYTITTAVTNRQLQLAEGAP